MFQMRVDQVWRFGDNVSISGVCENRASFTGRLKDNAGNKYEAYIPLGKDLVIDDTSILLCLNNPSNVDTLHGQVLIGA